MLDLQTPPENAKVHTVYGWLPCEINAGDPKRGRFRVTVTANVEPFPTWTHGGGAWVKTAAVSYTQVRFYQNGITYRAELLANQFVAVPETWPQDSFVIQVTQEEKEDGTQPSPIIYGGEVYERPSQSAESDSDIPF